MPVYELFQRHHRRLYRYFVRLSGEPSVAEDLTQEVFLRALRAESGYRAQGQEEAWLFRIARNLWIDRQRRRHCRPPVADSVPDELPAPASQELRLRLDEALGQLPEDEREAFLLCETGGLSYAQIASVCRISLEAVRSRIYRARRALRAALAEPAPKTLKLVEKT